MWVSGPGSRHEFPPWVLSAYQIAVKHGFTGTEREFRLSLLGEDGDTTAPALLITEEAEERIPEDAVLYMRPSGDDYAYYTQKDEFRTADLIMKVPDGLAVSGRTLRLTVGGTPYGTGTDLPVTELPEVSAADNGKVMKVIAGVWGAGEI